MQLKNQITEILSEAKDIIGQDLEIDQLFGLDYQSIEKTCEKETKGSYVGANLEASALYTSYFDFAEIAKKLNLKPGETFVDLGCGQARSILLYAALYPELNCLGIEFIPQRVQAAQAALKKIKSPNAQVIQGNLFEMPLPMADYYFIYLHVDHLLHHLLKQLKELAQDNHFKVIVIESHGDLIKNIDLEHPWLQNTNSHLYSHVPRHDPNIYVLESSPGHKMQDLSDVEKQIIRKVTQQIDQHGEIEFRKIPKHWHYSILRALAQKENYQLVVEDQDINSDDSHQWLADTLDIEHSMREHFLVTKYPPREIAINHIVKIKKSNGVLKELCRQRREKKCHPTLGEIRKIIIAPVQQIEYSNGARYSLDQY